MLYEGRWYINGFNLLDALKRACIINQNTGKAQVIEGILANNLNTKAIDFTKTVDKNLPSMTQSMNVGVGYFFKKKFVEMGLTAPRSVRRGHLYVDGINSDKKYILYQTTTRFDEEGNIITYSLHPAIDTTHGLAVGGGTHMSSWFQLYKNCMVSSENYLTPPQYKDTIALRFAEKANPALLSDQFNDHATRIKKSKTEFDDFVRDRGIILPKELHGGICESFIRDFLT